MSSLQVSPADMALTAHNMQPLATLVKPKWLALKRFTRECVGNRSGRSQSVNHHSNRQGIFGNQLLTLGFAKGSPKTSAGVWVDDVQNGHAVVESSVIFSRLQSEVLVWVQRYSQLCKNLPSIEQLLWRSPFNDSQALRFAIASLLLEGWLSLPAEHRCTQELLLGKYCVPPASATGVCCELLSVPVMQTARSCSTGAGRLHKVATIQMPNRLFHSAPDFMLEVMDARLCQTDIFRGDLIAFVRKHQAVEGQLVLVKLGGELVVCRMGKQNLNWVQLHKITGGGEALRLPAASFDIEGVMVGTIPSGA